MLGACVKRAAARRWEGGWGERPPCPRSPRVAVWQVLKSDTGKDCALFRKWGRIGTLIRNNMTQHMDESRCLAMFEQLFEEKTGNPWALRGDSLEPVGAQQRGRRRAPSPGARQGAHAIARAATARAAEAWQVLRDGPGLRGRRPGRPRQRWARRRRGHGRDAAVVPAPAGGSSHVAHFRHRDDAPGLACSWKIAL